MFKASTTALVAATILAVMAPVRTAPLLAARAAPGNANSIVRQNALEAQQLNVKFSSVKATDSCQGNEQACVNGAFAQCVQGKWTVHAPCAGNLQCFALPLVLKQGVALVCDTPQGAERRFQDAGVSGGTRGTGTAPAPIEDDDEVEDCEEEDELEGRLFAEDSDYHYFYKRQVATSEPVTLAEIPLPTVAPSASSAATAITTSSSTAAASPTVVIGSDGIVTVTVVSTVFASPTGCASPVSVSAPVLPTPISVSRAAPLSSVSPSSIPSSIRPTAFPSSASVSRASNVISLSAATAAASSSAPVVNPGVFSFTFARRAVPTPEST